MTRRVEDEVVILDVTSGRYFSLDGAGALVWERLEQDTTLGELVDAVVSAFDVDRETAAADIDELVAELAERGLIQQ
jgi:hypothetical protein